MHNVHQLASALDNANQQKQLVERIHQAVRFIHQRCGLGRQRDSKLQYGQGAVTYDCSDNGCAIQRP